MKTTILAVGAVIAALLIPVDDQTSTGPDVPGPSVSSLRGDDNGDGRIDEDESGWDCATMGNLRCGPVAVK